MKWGKCKEVEPLPQAGHPGTLSSLVPAACGHWAKPSPTYSVHPSPNPDPRDRCRGRGGSFSTTMVCSSNDSHQGLLLQEMEGKETFICPPQHNVGTAIGAAQMECGGGGGVVAGGREGREGMEGSWFSFQAWRLLPKEARGRTFVYLCVHPTP